ncbi:MAG: Smr/MutS family protein, partial [Bdellovibrionota bacterium]
QKLRRVVEQAQDEVRASVRKLDEMKSRREVDQTRSQLSATITTASRELENALKEEAPDLVEALAIPKVTEAESSSVKLEVGMAVRIPKWKNTGTILDVNGRKIKVAMGTMQMTLSPEDVEALPQKAGAQRTAKLTGIDTTYTAPEQIDLRGVRFEEAMSELARYLDHAYRSGHLVEVRVVHGLGTGAIREGTRKLLGKLPYVKAFRDGGAGQGGSGATIVEFDRD